MTTPRWRWPRRGIVATLRRCRVAAAISHEAAFRHEQRFFEHLDDDLDTPGALEELDDLAAELSSGNVDAGPGTEGQQLLGRLLSVLGAETEAVPA